MIEYQRWGNEQLVLPKLVRITVEGHPIGKKPWVMVDTAQFQQVEFNVVEDRDFTLEAFDLPDISTTKGTSKYPFDSVLFWLLLAVAVACGLGLWWIWRRKQRGTETKTT